MPPGGMLTVARRSSVLFMNDIARYPWYTIIVALSEIIRLMREIDEVIEVHGGWPGAYVTARAEDAT